MQLNVPDFFQSPAIEQLANVLADRPQARLASRVVQVQQGSGGLPVYFIGARPDEYRLGQMIGGDRPIFLVDALIPTEWIESHNADMPIPGRWTTIGVSADPVDASLGALRDAITYRVLHGLKPALQQAS